MPDQVLAGVAHATGVGMDAFRRSASHWFDVLRRQVQRIEVEHDAAYQAEVAALSQRKDIYSFGPRELTPQLKEILYEEPTT